MGKPGQTDGWTRVPNWLIDDSDLSLQELGVYIVLLRHRDHKTGTCFPGITTIADKARVSRETVKRVIPKLEERGMVRVERRSSIRENKPNLYHVALATETPAFIWADSSRGQRRPKRQLSDESRQKLSDAARKRKTVPGGSEFLGTDTDTETGASEPPASGSECPPPVAPSAPKKIQRKKIHEQASTHALPSASENRFSFDVDDHRATEKQIVYLKDLATHLSYGQTGGTPDEAQVQRWRKFTRAEATAQIRGYLKALGRPDEIDYPEYGTPEYEALSAAGKEFADTAGMPESVWDYGFALKENRSA